MWNRLPACLSGRFQLNCVVASDIYRLTKHRPCHIYISCHRKINIGPRDPYAMQYMYMAAWGFQCYSLVEAPLLPFQHAGSLRRISDFAS